MNILMIKFGREKARAVKEKKKKETTVEREIADKKQVNVPAMASKKRRTKTENVIYDSNQKTNIEG